MDFDNETTDDYIENVDVNKSVTIEQYSNNGPNPQIKASAKDTHVFNITSDNVTISGLSIYGATGFNKAGIYLGKGTANCTIQNNRCGYDSDHRNYYGINLDNSANNTVSGNTCNQNVGDGIRIYYSINNIITGNHFDQNSSYGMELDNTCNNNTIYLNDFIGNTPANVDSTGSTNTWHSPGEMTCDYTSGSLHAGYLVNHYSDYSGDDDGTGSRTAGDSLGDTNLPYTNDGDGDNYPLISTSANYTEVITYDLTMVVEPAGSGTTNPARESIPMLKIRE